MLTSQIGYISLLLAEWLKKTTTKQQNTTTKPTNHQQQKHQTVKHLKTLNNSEKNQFVCSPPTRTILKNIYLDKHFR